MAIQNLGKSDNAATYADFLNYIGQQTRKNTFAWIIGHLNPFVNSNNCNFPFQISDVMRVVFFYHNGCPMPVRPTQDESTSLSNCWHFPCTPVLFFIIGLLINIQYLKDSDYYKVKIWRKICRICDLC